MGTLRRYRLWKVYSMLITKADGTQEEFDPQKLVDSLRRSGAEEDATAHIVEEIQKELTPLMRTGDIYRRAFAHLREERHGVAARYSLKRALLDLGPSGFPFETYIGEIYRAKGYATMTGQIVKGHCVEHEVDVIAKKGDEVHYMEAKFHNTAGFKTDLKVVLYVKARTDDIVKGHPKQNVRGSVITNTKFTSRAIGYAGCENLGLIGWEFPRTGNLHDLIEETGLYPITALTSLSRRERDALLAQRVVLCKSLSMNGDVLTALGVKQGKADRAVAEAAALCGKPPSR